MSDCHKKLVRILEECYDKLQEAFNEMTDAEYEEDEHVVEAVGLQDSIETLRNELKEA